MKKILGLTLVLLMSTSAWAQRGGKGSGTMLSLNWSMFSQETEFGSAKSEYAVTNIDGTLGYIFSSGLYLGGIFNSTTVDTGDKITGSHYGVSVGYVRSGWLIHAHYLLGGTVDDDAGGDLEKGAGYQVDLGYNFNLGGAFFLGPQITYRTMEYEFKDVATDEKLEKTDMFPSIRLTFIW